MATNTLSELPYSNNEEVLIDMHNKVNIMGSTINKTLLHCEHANIPNNSANDELSEIDPDKCIQNNLSKKCNYYNQAEFNATFSANRNLSIMHTNIRSSEANLKEFSYYLNEINVEFTFIILSETWATNLICIQYQDTNKLRV